MARKIGAIAIIVPLAAIFGQVTSCKYVCREERNLDFHKFIINFTVQGQDWGEKTATNWGLDRGKQGYQQMNHVIFSLITNNLQTHSEYQR